MIPRKARKRDHPNQRKSTGDDRHRLPHRRPHYQQKLTKRLKKRARKEILMMIPRNARKRDRPGDDRHRLPHRGPLHHLRKAALGPAEADVARRNDHREIARRNVADPVVLVTGAPHLDLNLVAVQDRSLRTVVARDPGLVTTIAVAGDQILVIVALLALVNIIIGHNKATMVRNKMNTGLMAKIIVPMMEDITTVEVVADTLMEEATAEENVAATIPMVVRTTVHTDRKWV